MYSEWQNHDSLAAMLSDEAGMLVAKWAPGWSRIAAENMLRLWEGQWGNSVAGCIHQADWRICPGHYGSPGKTCSSPGYTTVTPEEIAAAQAEALKTGVAVIGGRSYQCAENRIGQPCPETGYRFGHSWLWKPLSAADEACVLALSVRKTPREFQCGLCGADIVLDPFHACPLVKARNTV